MLIGVPLAACQPVQRPKISGIHTGGLAASGTRARNFRTRRVRFLGPYLPLHRSRLAGERCRQRFSNSTRLRVRAESSDFRICHASNCLGALNPKLSSRVFYPRSPWNEGTSHPQPNQPLGRKGGGSRFVEGSSKFNYAARETGPALARRRKRASSASDISRSRRAIICRAVARNLSMSYRWFEASVRKLNRSINLGV